MPRADRVNRAFKARVQKLSRQITTTDLTDADTSQSISLGTPPTGARCVGVRIGLATPFTGGGVTAVTASVGPAADPDKLVAAADIFSAAVDGEASDHPLGIAPNGAVGGVEQFVQVDSTTANVADITAGDMTVELLYAVAEA